MNEDENWTGISGTRVSRSERVGKVLWVGPVTQMAGNRDSDVGFALLKRYIQRRHAAWIDDRTGGANFCRDFGYWRGHCPPKHRRPLSKDRQTCYTGSPWPNAPTISPSGPNSGATTRR